MKLSKALLLSTPIILIVGDNIWEVFNNPSLYYKYHSVAWVLITSYCLLKEKDGKLSDLIFKIKGFTSFKIALCFFLLAVNDLIVELFFDGTITEVNAYIYLVVVIVYLIGTSNIKWNGRKNKR